MFKDIHFIGDDDKIVKAKIIKSYAPEKGKYIPSVSWKNWGIDELIDPTYVAPKKPDNPKKPPGKKPPHKKPPPEKTPHDNDKWNDQRGEFTEAAWFTAGQDWQWFGFDFQTDGVYLHNSDKNFKIYLKFCHLTDITSNGGNFAFDIRYSIAYRREAGDRHSVGYRTIPGSDFTHDNQTGSPGRNYWFEPNTDINWINGFLDEGQYRLEIHVKSGLGNVQIGRGKWGKLTSIEMQYKWVNVTYSAKGEQETEHTVTETIYPSGKHTTIDQSNILPKTGK